jgi:hypothetical protein
MSWAAEERMTRRCAFPKVDRGRTRRTTCLRTFSTASPQAAAICAGIPRRLSEPTSRLAVPIGTTLDGNLPSDRPHQGSAE